MLDEFTEQQQEGAKWVLTEALETEADDQVLIVHDEYTASVAECLATVGNEDLNAAVKTELVLFSKQCALSIGEHVKLPRNLCRMIDPTSRFIVLQKRAPEVNDFRHKLLEYARHGRKRRRVASMPGITLKYLHLCRGDLRAITKRCELVAAQMARSRVAKLETQALDGTKLTLTMPIGLYKPIQSTGRIVQGDWGNVPSGETFVVPDPYAADGRVAIDGSIVNYEIPPGEELVLELQEGRVDSRLRVKGAISNHVQRLLFDADGCEAYPNCTVLSELGVGTNADVHEFTGLPIFDEKILGTVHLGLGRSTQFKGPTSCRVHNDFTIKQPRLMLNSTLVTENGHFVLAQSDVYPNWQQVELPPGGERCFYGRGPETYLLDDGPNGQCAYLTWRSPRGGGERKARVGDEETSRVAGMLLQLINSMKNPLTVEHAIKSLDSVPDGRAIAHTLELLVQYNLAKRT